MRQSQREAPQWTHLTIGELPWQRKRQTMAFSLAASKSMFLRLSWILLSKPRNWPLRIMADVVSIPTRAKPDRSLFARLGKLARHTSAMRLERLFKI